MMRARSWTTHLGMAIGVTLALSAPRAKLFAQEAAYAASLSDLDSTTQAVLGKEIAKARERGLPVDPLVAKVREGRLKRAPSARIRSAVERLSERLGQARDALGASSTSEEVTAGADAIAAGAQPSSLRVVRAATAQSVTAPIGALAQLLASGVSETKAVEMVLSLLRRNASPALLIALGNEVEADVATGLSADASAAFRLRGVESQLNGSATVNALGDAQSTGKNVYGNPANTGTTSAPRRKP